MSRTCRLRAMHFRNVLAWMAGTSLGCALIADAFIRTESFRIGAYALIVDAKDERARAFYAANDFASLPDEARRIFLPMATALQLLENERRG